VNLDADALAAALDERTLLVVVSQVLFRSACIVDVAAVCRQARAVGAVSLVDGYHADHTRTVAIGDPGPELTAVHELVQRAQAAGRAAAVAGVTAGEVDAAAREVIEDAGYGERFVHGTGHGVGLQIHEAPTVARDARATLAAGTALTVEPGVYLPGTGGVRIEDTLVITPDGAPTALTDTPRTLRVL
jgi:Xaa-Pro aminopeptidase